MFDMFLNLNNFFIGIIPLILIAIGIWLWALIDCITSNKETSEKLVWVLIIIFFSVIGAIIYLIVSSGRKESILTKELNEKTNSRLYRSRTDNMIGGVCGGLANYFKIDPVFIRLIFVLLVIFKGSGILIYIIAWIIIPLEPKNKNEINDKKINDKIKNDKKNVKKSNKGLIIFLIIFGLIIISIIGFVMLFKTTSEVAKSLTIEEKDFIVRMNDKGIFIEDQRNIVITNDETKYDKIKNNVELRILNDYNYIAYNGSDLKFLGLKDSKECENRLSCYEVIYEYNIETEKLENKSFRVQALISNYDLIYMNFTQI